MQEKQLGFKCMMLRLGRKKLLCLSSLSAQTAAASSAYFRELAILNIHAEQAMIHHESK